MVVVGALLRNSGDVEAETNLLFTLFARSA